MIKWTTELDDELKLRAAAGESAQMIATGLGMTRNMVIGRLHRLGIKTKMAKIANGMTVKPRVLRPRAVIPRRVKNMVAGKPCNLLGLTNDNCHWPLNEGARVIGWENVVFCGGQAIEGEAYCAEHTRMAYGGGK